ncbi:MAG: hypothetical protein ACP5NV_00630 [Candidatus Woesearchaeota archaeon]
MNITSKIKDIWNYHIKPIVTNPKSYLTLATFTIGGSTLAQENPKNYQKPKTEIRQEGNNIIVPEEKLQEFLKTTTKKNNVINKVTDITLDGYITSALNNNPIEGIKVTAQVYDGSTLTGTYGPMLTDILGYYRIPNITDVDDQKTPTNESIIKYHGNKIITNDTEEKTIKIYDATTKEEIKTIITTDSEIDINLENMASGRYLTIIKTKKWADANLLVQDGGKIIGYTKTEGKKSIDKKTIEKITTLGLVMDITDTTNNYHRYFSGAGEFETNNPQRDFSLIPRTSLEQSITDPEYTTIPTINTLRDLWWYVARVEGDWDNKTTAKSLFPIALYVGDNAPIGATSEVRDVIQYFRDSIGIHPDSLIRETPIPIEPAFENGFGAMKIIYTDSTVLGYGNSEIGFVFSAHDNALIGGHIYIDTNKVHGEDIGKYVAMNLQRYITQGINPINNPNFLGYTTRTRIGPRNRPNNDEKNLIKTGRFSKPFYINRVYE